MKKQKIKIELKDIDLVKNLIELLQTKFDELPKDIQESIMQIEEGGLNDIDYDKFIELFGSFDNYENSFHSKEIASVNKILKKVCYIETDTKGNILRKVEYPEHFWCSANGEKVIEW